MFNGREQYVYLCAFAHYTGGKLVVSTECVTLDRPIDPDGLHALNTDLQDRGFSQAMVISFSLFGPLKK